MMNDVPIATLLDIASASPIYLFKVKKACQPCHAPVYIEGQLGKAGILDALVLHEIRDAVAGFCISHADLCKRALPLLWMDVLSSC